MVEALQTTPRVRVDGKFFRAGSSKFFVKGVAYGPFAPNNAGLPFASPEQTAADLSMIREAGANLVRVYYVPQRWFLDLALAYGLRVLVDIPWDKNFCFLEEPEQQAAAIEAVRRAVYSCSRHPAVFAFSVANEIPPDVVRWSGAEAVSRFIDRLIEEAKKVDPDCLCTYSNFPPTEFLQPARVDFLCFNVYLHQPQALESYLSRLQMLADSKPLLIGEVGIDSIREGEDRKCEMLSWQIERTFRSGAAGLVVFSFTDDWYKNGKPIEDWGMGITTATRQPKESFASVARQFRAAPHFPLPRCPRISVVVAAYNAERTLKLCLESLSNLNYRDYEVILVDDGSSDKTATLAKAYPSVRCIRHERNRGLSAARNTGIQAASGEIVAFTDADCRADPDWLYYIASALLAGDYCGVGGPNLLPPEDSAVATAVMLSPGGPAHVMLSDSLAEHIPGCNMAFFKSALTSIDGFDPVFTKAGDDVDLCWRLQSAGCKIGFSPSAVVWHYRRSTVRAYLKQQIGYGEAEALLIRKHPEYFNALGGSIWKGRIYGQSIRGPSFRRSVIYRGLFGSAGFQSVYSVDNDASSLMFFTTLEYHLLVTLPLWILSLTFPALLPMAITSALLSIGICAAAGAQARLPVDKSFWWSRPLVALMFLLQPIARGWARYRGRLMHHARPPKSKESLESIALRQSSHDLSRVAYASAHRLERLNILHQLVDRLDREGWPNKPDTGWSDFDVEIYGSRWANVQLITACEEHRDAQVVRFRLKPKWSLQARTAFWTFLGGVLLVIGLFAGARPWFWLLLLALPAAAFYIHTRTRALQSLIIALLDKLAEDLQFKRLHRAPAPAKPKPSIPAEDSPFAEKAQSQIETANKRE